MKIIFNNSKMEFRSNLLVKKGALDIDTLVEDLSDASVNTSGAYIFAFEDCTGVDVKSINIVPGYADGHNTVTIYKVNKLTGDRTLLDSFTPTTQEEVGHVVNIPVNVSLADNEYIGVTGQFYYKGTGGDSFYVQASNGRVTTGSTVYPYYNIVGLEQ